MNAKTGELRPYLNQMTQCVSLGASMTDLTLIFNYHGTREHAQESVAYVSPDSAVFLEAYDPHQIGAPFGPELRELAEIRLQQGKDSKDYVDLKNAILATIGESDDYIPTAEDKRHLPYMLEVIRELLHKDCYVSYADKVGMADAGDPNPPMPGLPVIAANGPVLPALEALQQSCQTYERVDYGRDMEAAGRSLMWLGSVASIGSPHAPVTSEGRLAGFVLRGSTHARSLTALYRRFNVQPKCIELQTIADYQYIDDPTSQANAPRRLAQAALWSLAVTIVESNEMPPGIHESYAALEYFNSAPPEELEKFLITCANIRREEARSFDNAQRWYHSLLRSLVPDVPQLTPNTRPVLL